MNAEIPEGRGTQADELVDEEQELRSRLISQLQLDSADLDRISEFMAVHGLSFAGAAVKLGLVSLAELQSVLYSIRFGTRSGGSGPGTTVARVGFLQKKALPAIRPQTVYRLADPLLLSLDSQNHRAEQIRGLRTSLLLVNARVDAGLGNALAVVSPCPREGRSRLAAELAISFAQLGRRTLLVDADLRAPSQSKFFLRDPSSTATDGVTFGDPENIGAVLDFPDLSVLAPVTVPKDPLEILSAGPFEQLVRRWRRQYDQVIVDTPPSSRYADALSVAQTAGEVLVIGRIGKTAHRDIKDLVSRLAATRARVLGAVLNRF